MNATDWFVDMARNHVWANTRIYDACVRLAPAELSAQRTSFFPGIDRTLWHIALVDLFYLNALEQTGESVAVFDRHDQPPRLDELRATQQACDRRLVHFTESLDVDSLRRLATVDRGERGRFPDRVGDILLHVFQHAIHHRGQVHAMLSGTPVPPPQLDEFFLQAERPQAEKELAAHGFSRAR